MYISCVDVSIDTPILKELGFIIARPDTLNNVQVQPTPQLEIIIEVVATSI